MILIDPTPVGLETVPVEVQVRDGRALHMTLDSNGFAMVPHAYDHIDYYNESQVLKVYYPECCRLVKEMTGAKKVYAFDHNIRSTLKSDGDNSERREIIGGNKVQVPLALVHNDYTLTSAPKRVTQLGEAPKVNDTLRKILGETPLFSSKDLEEIVESRYVFINVWRNIADVPVQDMPLALCDAQSFAPEDLVTFEVRYEDRVGENYFVKHSTNHNWVYFPSITKNEAILLKVWDSHGAITAAEVSEKVDIQTEVLIPASFSFHTAFKDPTAQADCSRRESIECRLIAVY